MNRFHELRNASSLIANVSRRFSSTGRFLPVTRRNIGVQSRSSFEKLRNVDKFRFSCAVSGTVQSQARLIFSLPPRRNRNLLLGQIKPSYCVSTRQIGWFAAIPFVLKRFLISPIVKFGAAILGRVFRNWYFKRHPHHQRKLYELYLAHRLKLVFVAGAAGLLFVSYYINHLQPAPVTGRLRYVTVTTDQLTEVMEYFKDQGMPDLFVKLNAADELPRDHPVHLGVTRIVMNLMKSNKELTAPLKKRGLKVHVLNSDTPQAFCAYNGDLYVCLGLAKMTTNEHQMAVVLSHELAHLVCGHQEEKISWMWFTDWIVVTGLAGIWALFPGINVPVITTFFMNKTLELLLHLPYSRKLEKEADTVGLQMAAKACYDVREAYVLWADMHARASVAEKGAPEFLRTHPSHKLRATTLDSEIPSAIRLREQCNCYPLRADRDPRVFADARVRLAELSE